MEFVVRHGVLEKCVGSDPIAVIPDGVTRIGYSAFRGCKSLTSVTIPDGVTTIGHSAFLDCSSLSSVTIPQSVTRIENKAFRGCPTLTIVCREDSDAHRYCRAKRLYYIFDYQYEAFHGTVPAGVKRLSAPFMADEEGPYVFVSYSHRDRDSVFPIIKELYESGWRIWYDEGLTIGDRYDETIEAHVRGCAAFLLFVTPNSLESSYIKRNEVPWAVSSHRPIIRCALEDGARYEIESEQAYPHVAPEGLNDALRSIAGLKKGERRAARGISVAVDPAARAARIDGIDPAARAAASGVALCLYSHDGEATARTVMLEARRAGCALHDGVQEPTGNEAIEGCACLVVFLDEAFLQDERLVRILAERHRRGADVALCQVAEVDEDNLSEGLEGLGKTQWLRFDRGISADAVSRLARHLQDRGCRDASIIPGFECNIEDRYIVVRRYVGSVEEPRLEAEYGGLPVTLIAGGTFESCASIRKFEIPAGVTRIGGGAFKRCTNLTSLIIPEGVAEIGDSAFLDCTSLSEIAIPEGVTTIEESTFRRCEGLTSVIIPNSVTEIRDRAFSWCKSLTSVIIPDSVTTIGKLAFEHCSHLSSVIIPDSVTTIGDWAFVGCSHLSSVSIPASATRIGGSAFRGCSRLSSVSIPGGVTEIGESAFRSCEGLTSLTIPGGVTRIGDWSFSGCKSLTSLIISEGVVEIGDQAFAHCGRLVVTCSPDSCAWKYCKEHDIPIRQ